MKVKQNKETQNNITIINAELISTRNYNDKDGKFETEVKRKSMALVPSSTKDKKALEALGFTEYTTEPNENGEIFKYYQLKFSNKTVIFDMEKMVKQTVILDDNFPNFDLTNLEVAVTTFENKVGQLSKRVVALKTFSNSEYEEKTFNPFGFSEEEMSKFISSPEVFDGIPEDTQA